MSRTCRRCNPERMFDLEMLKEAAAAAAASDDPSQKFGCVIVNRNEHIQAIGYNRPIGRDLPSRRERPNKYLYWEHAERLAIFDAAKTGRNLHGSTLYLSGSPCNGTPCADCARAIILAGIERVVMLKRIDPPPARWAASVAAGLDILGEARVQLIIVPEENT